MNSAARVRAGRVAVCGLVLGVAGCGSSDAVVTDASVDNALTTIDVSEVERVAPIATTSSTSTTVQLLTSTTLAQPDPLPPVQVDPGTNGTIGSLIRFGDQSLPSWSGAPLVNWVIFQTASELASASSIVAVARLDGARPAVRSLTLEPTVEDPAGLNPIEYDGLVFTAEEVLVGTIAPGDEIVVAVPAVAIDDDQTWRVPSDFVEPLSSGLSDQPGRRRYLIFANQRDGWAPVYEFATPAGVTEVDGDGLLRGAWRDSPFASQQWTIEDVRQAIETGQ